MSRCCDYVEFAHAGHLFPASVDSSDEKMLTSSLLEAAASCVEFSFRTPDIGLVQA